MSIFTKSKVRVTRPLTSTGDVRIRCGTRVTVRLWGFKLFSYFRPSAS